MQPARNEEQVEITLSVEALRTSMYAAFYIAIISAIAISLLFADINYESNIIKDTFGVTNVCVFFDFPPATYFSPILWGGVLILGTAERAVTLVRLSLAKKKGVISGTEYAVLCTCVAYNVFSLLYFSVCFAVKPRDLHSLRVHTLPYMNLQVSLSIMACNNLFYAFRHGYDGYNFNVWQKTIIGSYPFALLSASVICITQMGFCLYFGKPWVHAPFPFNISLDKLWLFLAIIVPPAWNFYLANERSDQSENVSFAMRLCTQAEPAFHSIIADDEAQDGAEEVLVEGKLRTTCAWLLRFPHVVFVPIFIALLMSPLNNPEPYMRILTQQLWRKALYLGGVLMGLSYAAAGFLIVVHRPFSSQMLSGIELQRFAYTMLVPMGLSMCVAHCHMMHTRLGSHSTPGCTIGNAKVIGACTLAQCVWLVMWAIWFAAALRYDVRQKTAATLESADARTGCWDTCSKYVMRRIAMGLTCLGSSIVVASIIIRLGFMIASGGSLEAFDKTYCGGSVPWSV